jgi:hypothetical protein
MHTQASQWPITEPVDYWRSQLVRGAEFCGEWEIPAVPPCHIIPDKLTSFTDARAHHSPDTCIHFYQGDRKFICIWNNPRKYLPLLQSCKAVIAPDFSLYRELPFALQPYALYQSAALNYWWSTQGVNVIPNGTFSDERSFPHCFAHLPENSVIAVGSHGCTKHKDDKEWFTAGVQELVRQKHPHTILVYGAFNDSLLPPLFHLGTMIVQYPSDFATAHEKGVKVYG